MESDYICLVKILYSNYYKKEVISGFRLYDVSTKRCYYGGSNKIKESSRLFKHLNQELKSLHKEDGFIYFHLTREKFKEALNFSYPEIQKNESLNSLLIKLGVEEYAI